MQSTPRVLLVDDDADSREATREYLEYERFEVDEAADGARALAAAQLRVPHAVVLDLMLPDGDGAQLARRLRLLDGMGSVPIVVVTGRSDHDLLASGLFTACFRKPVDPSKLVAELRRVIQRG